MPDRPLLLFSDPVPVAKAMRHGGATNIFRPPYQRQVERLSPKFAALQQTLDNGRIRIGQDRDEVDPEYTLVLEVAGDPNDFETAVRNTQGIEWLFEAVDFDARNGDEFYRLNASGQRDDKKEMMFKYFCILTNQRALQEMLSLWNNFKNNENYTFPRGQAGLKNVFKTLKDIHLWGAAERLEETGVLAAWEEDLNDPSVSDVKCEIELFYRRSTEKRLQSENSICTFIQGINGNVIAVSCIEEINYHAILVSIPREYAERIIAREEVALVSFEQIMFFKPTGQSIVLGSDDGLPTDKAFPAVEHISEEPIIALFDGLPQEQHPLLSGVLSVDDPDDYTAAYQITDRKHGTSMASIIARGDLLVDDGKLVTRKIYVRPIMKPYPALDGTCEYIPDDMLIVDRIHAAVRRLFEPEAGQVASSIRIINLSIGIGTRLYYNMISPLARLLDWLSFKYRVLFIVSAGNHPDDIDLEIPFSDYKALSMEDRDKQMIQIINHNLRNNRLLSPAESMNALTVGALFDDSSEFQENPRQLLPCSNSIPSPISSVGRGINKSIKPDILFRGGRGVLTQNPIAANHAIWRDHVSAFPPGILSAKPFLIAGSTNYVGYSFGTSDAAALITHEASACFDVLSEIFHVERNCAPPSEYVALLLKAMLVHGAKWNSTARLICDETGLDGRGADQVHKWMGYGVPDMMRVHECARTRATVIGYGELTQDSACQYILPLPFNFSTHKIFRCLTITMAYFTPIKPTFQKYRASQLWFTLNGDKKLGIKRTDADDKAVTRGTIQHERFAGNGAVIWGEEDTLSININCRADACELPVAIPYAVFVTFEVAPESDIDVYQRIVNKIRPRETITP